MDSAYECQSHGRSHRWGSGPCFEIGIFGQLVNPTPVTKSQDFLQILPKTRVKQHSTSNWQKRGGIRNFLFRSAGLTNLCNFPLHIPYSTLYNTPLTNTAPPKRTGSGKRLFANLTYLALSSNIFHSCLPCKVVRCFCVCSPMCVCVCTLANTYPLSGQEPRLDVVVCLAYPPRVAAIRRCRCVKRRQLFAPR